jgi:hypothetical protein
LKNGYRPKGHVTVQVEGQLVKVPVAQIKIVPPQGGTAAVKKPQSCRGVFRCNKPEAGEGLKMSKEQRRRGGGKRGISEVGTNYTQEAGTEITGMLQEQKTAIIRLANGLSSIANVKRKGYTARSIEIPDWMNTALAELAGKHKRTVTGGDSAYC